MGNDLVALEPSQVMPENLPPARRTRFELQARRDVGIGRRLAGHLGLA
jgi:hypothetical protein